jgi:pimeloyl-ACP methyl ester carboxylesterase
VEPGRIALHGRSLGSGVAVQVAAARPARCVLLTSAFDSARAIAAAIYFWVPVGMLMRHPFDSESRAADLRMPALFLVAEGDSIVPPRHSHRLADAWGGPVERVSFPGFGHNDLSLHPGYAKAIQAFLARSLD